MERQNIESTVLEVVSTVLKEDVTSQASRGDFAKWDSLKHIEIMFALEEAFDMAFSEDELAMLDSVQKIIDRVTRDAS